MSEVTRTKEKTSFIARVQTFGRYCVYPVKCATLIPPVFSPCPPSNTAADRGPAQRAVPVQEAPHAQPGQQLPAVSAVALRRADGADAAGAEGQPPGVSAGGARRVSTAQEDGPGGGGGPL